MDRTFPKGIEVVCGIVIRDQKGNILVTRSQHWSDKWVLPGGHIDSGETITEAAVREGEEETGLKLRAVDIFNSGQLIGSKDFSRPAHFIYFNVLLEIEGGQVQLDEGEHFDYQWVSPREALKLELAESFADSILKYIDFEKNKSK